MDCVFTNETYSLTAAQLARSAMLSELATATGSTRVEMDDSLLDSFLVAYRYLTDGTLPTAQEFSTIDYFGIKPWETYQLSTVRELAMRAEMYQEDASEEYLAEAYGLHIIDRHFWEHFTPQRRVTPSTLFVGPDPVKAEWLQIEERLAELREFTDGGNVFVAGGCIFSILFGLPTADIDLFYYGLTQEEATRRLHAFRPKGRPNILRTKNAVTYYRDRKGSPPEVQVVLRLYPTKSCIINAFDVDSCAVGFDGKNIYATTRALYALENLTNTVNFDRLSPTYERRLAKYGARGIAVEVPDFDRALVNEERLASDFLVSSAWYYTSTTVANRYNRRLGKSPLDMLLMMERHLEHYAYRGRSQTMVKNFAHEMSDYGMTGSLAVTTPVGGHRVDRLMEYLGMEPPGDCTYRDKIAAYTPLLERLEGSKVESWRKLWMSNPFLSKSITYLSTGKEKCFEQVLSVDPELYAILSVLRPVDFAAEIEWKVTQPGEQMTNTFHRLVLEDRSLWYNGSYYNNSEEWGNYARAWRIPPEVYCMRDLLGAEESKAKHGLLQRIGDFSEQFEPVATNALREYIAEHGIREADVLYISNSLNRMQFPVFWTGKELADHVAYFDFGRLCTDHPFDYWSKAYPDYNLLYKGVAVDSVITVCGKVLSVAHLHGHERVNKFLIRYNHGRISVSIPWRLLRQKPLHNSDSEVQSDSIEYDSDDEY